MNPKEIGKTLKKAREAMGIELPQASRETRIRDFYLAALEKGDFEQLPSSAQVKGFIRSYARFLALDENAIFNAGEENAKIVVNFDSKEAEEPIEAQGTEKSPSFEKQFAKLGKELRERREILELSLKEIAVQIHIDERYLGWIEEGQHQTFPSPTQARGMLKNYAGFLGLEKEALGQFGEALQEEFESKKNQVQSLPPKSIKEKKRLRPPKWARRFLSADILVGVGLTTGLAIIFVWGLGQVVGIQAEQENPPTAPPLAELLIPSPSMIPVATAKLEISDGDENNSTDATFPQVTIQVANPGNVKVQIFPLQREWIRVSVDGSVEFEGRIVVGENYSYSGNTEIIVYTGNAAAFRIFLNEQDLGVVGIEGEVIELLFSRSGLATPSPTAAPSQDPNIASDTPIASATPESEDSVDGDESAP